MKDICERYGLPYNTGPFLKQLGMVQRTIVRLAFPGGKPRPKPGPYKPDDGEAPTERKRNLFQRRKDGNSGPEQPTSGVRVSMPNG